MAETPLGRAGVPKIRVFGITKYSGVRGSTYTVRWVVGGKRHQSTFTSRRPADSFRSELIVASRGDRRFDLRSGLPITANPGQQSIEWIQLAREFVDHKWPRISPRHRKSIAEALTAVTIALLDAVPPNEKQLRRAVFGWALNSGRRDESAPDELADALSWVEHHTRPITDLTDPKTLHSALDSIAYRMDGEPASSATFRRKRSALHSALEFGVQMNYLDANPLSRSTWTEPTASSGNVDRRVVANPTTARELLAAVAEISAPLEAFFACLYYAALRPAEAVNLKLDDCHLPAIGWGRLDVHSSYQVAGTAWTASGEAGESRPLKHRALDEVRSVPAHPELVTSLGRHIAEFGVGLEGRLFVTRTGKAGVPLPAPYAKPLSMGTAYRVWHKARAAALTDKQFDSKLARRPYDLRHACVSTWLNAGVPATQVAEWAGHSVAVLLRVYAKCLDGQAVAAMQRIESALRDAEE